MSITALSSPPEHYSQQPAAQPLDDSSPQPWDGVFTQQQQQKRPLNDRKRKRIADDVDDLICSLDSQNTEEWVRERAGGGGVDGTKAFARTTQLQRDIAAAFQRYDEATLDRKTRDYANDVAVAVMGRVLPVVVEAVATVRELDARRATEIMNAMTDNSDK